MGHAMATAGRGPRLLRRGGLLSVCRPVAPNWLLYCVAPQHSLSEALGDGDEAMSHQYILDKMSSVENTSLALAQMEEVSTFISLLPDPDRISDMCFPLKRRTVSILCLPQRRHTLVGVILRSLVRFRQARSFFFVLQGAMAATTARVTPKVARWPHATLAAGCRPTTTYFRSHRPVLSAAGAVRLHQ